MPWGHLRFACQQYVSDVKHSCRHVLLQALAVQHPSWLPYYSEAVPHVTVSVAEGVPPREAGDLVRDAKSRGARARIMPLVGVKLLHGESPLDQLAGVKV